MSSLHTFQVACPECGDELELEFEYNPPDVYGADADGNRGMLVPGYFTCSTDLTATTCESGCHTTPDYVTRLTEAAERTAEERSRDRFEDDGPEPEDYS